MFHLREVIRYVSRMWGKSFDVLIEIGLTFDNRTERYLVNDTTHTKLLQLNPSITFKLSVNATGGTTLNLNFPYAAFDLQASYPIYSNRTNYFPLRRAFNDSQYTLGRTFLQEAYVLHEARKLYLSY